jgi:ribosomal protein S16
MALHRIDSLRGVAVDRFVFGRKVIAETRGLQASAGEGVQDRLMGGLRGGAGRGKPGHRTMLRAGLMIAILGAGGLHGTAAQAQSEMGAPENAGGQTLADSQGTATVPLPVVATGQAPEGSVGGMGDVNLYPRRVVMSARDRSATVGLYNRAAVSGDYDITISDMMMQPDGRLVELGSVSDPASAAKVHTASAFLRWSPRKVTLPASEAQLVRIMLRVPPDLPAGEYRAHFSAVSIPPVAEGLTIDQAAGAETSGVGVQIVPRFGISIPVIVRVGETSAVAGLKDLGVGREGVPVVSLVVTRQGTRSVFGNIVVTAAGAKAPIAQIKGIGVYTELQERAIQIPINPQTNPAYYANGAKLTVTYTDDDYAPGQILAKSDFVVR